MNTQSGLRRRFGGPYTLAAGALFTALFWIMPVSAIADPRAATSSDSRVADVSLSDLDLSTPAGMRAARDRVHTAAQRVCANRESSYQPAFVACVDSTVANELRQIDALRQTKTTVRNSVTLAAHVSLADLDLSTLEGALAARTRLEAMARRLCAQLARDRELQYQPNYGACVHDTLAGALAQADLLAASKNARTAQRSAP